MAMEHLPQLPAVAARVLEEGFQRESDGMRGQVESSGLDRLDVAIVFLARDRLPFDDVARSEEHHEIPEVGSFLRRIVDRHRRDAEHLIAAGPAHGIDAAEAAAMPDGERRRIRAPPQILRY